MEDPKGVKKTLKELADDEPQRHDVFIGLVAPIGSSRTEAANSLKAELRIFGYDFDLIRLADLLEDVPRVSAGSLPKRVEPDYYKSRMDAGDDLREFAGDWSALAALAIARVADKRNVKRKIKSSRPTAYVFDSLKHPREAALLQSVYGSAFWLVSLVQDGGERVKNLAAELSRQEGKFDSAPDARAIELIARDEADPDAAHGQHVRDVFAEADYFLPIQKGTKWRDQVGRFVQGLFDAPFVTPSSEEEAMRHAQAASLRSAAIGRQVGAVIVPKMGTPFILGTNEVPKPGGGQFREGDVPDHRDFQSGSDPNPAYTQRLVRELMGKMADAEYFTTERNEAGGDAVLEEALKKGDDGRSLLDDTRAKSLIEFTRCLHAEQAAIVDAARSGVAIDGARLYTTTFPCHECTKFIIGAGIVEVQYVEPYPKSLAGELYADLIDTLAPMTRRSDEAMTLERVPFRPFLGFGPGRYDDVFTASERRAGERIAEPDPEMACPVGRGWSEVAVQTKESEVSTAILAVLKDLKVAVGHTDAADDSDSSMNPSVIEDSVERMEDSGS